MSAPFQCKKCGQAFDMSMHNEATCRGRIDAPTRRVAETLHRSTPLRTICPDLLGHSFEECSDKGSYYLMAANAISAMAEPEPNPYTELIDKLAQAAHEAWLSEQYPSLLWRTQLPSETKDDWRNVAKAVIEGLRAECLIGWVREYGGGQVSLTVDRDLERYPILGTPMFILPKEPNQ